MFLPLPQLALAAFPALASLLPPAPPSPVQSAPPRGLVAAQSEPDPEAAQGLGPSCPKPPVPHGGFATFTDYNNFVTYSDGYLSLGDLTWPEGVGHGCRWPLVILVHGLPGSRINQRQRAEQIARRGFAVWAYEVRGQAQSVIINPPGKGFGYYGPQEKFDLAEQVAFVRQAFPNVVHQNAVAVTGNSQGGIHAWFAAAYSGETITAPGRGTIQFPVISCAVPFNFNPDSHDHFLRESSLFNAGFVSVIFEPNSDILVKDPGFITGSRVSFVAQDPLNLGSTWNAEPHRTWFERFAHCQVPVLWQHSFLDQVGMPKAGFDAAAIFPATTPLRIELSTNGHGSPENAYELESAEDLRLRWFDRFLWGIQNGVEHETARNAAVLPLDPQTFNDATAVWLHRRDLAIEPNDVDYASFQLYGPSQMGPIVPLAMGAPATITHDVPVGFGPSAWVAGAPWSMENLYATIPLDEVVYEAPPLSKARELAGRPRLVLSIVPDATRFQISAMVEVEAPGLAPVALSTWGKGALNATVGAVNELAFDLPPIVALLPEGTVIRLRLRNLWTSGYPMPQQLKAVPYFVSSTVAIQHGPSPALSFLELPFRQAVRLSADALVTRVDSLDPQPTSIRIDGGSERAGQAYHLLAGASGQVPGIPLGNATLPLNFDPVAAFVNSGISLSDPAFVGFSGVLDEEGRTTATLDWAQLPALLASVQGQYVTFAAWTVDDNVVRISNPTNVFVE